MQQSEFPILWESRKDTFTTMKFTLASIAVLATSVAAFQPSLTSGRASTALQSSLKRETGKSQLDPAVIQRYNDLPFPEDTILAEYVWVDAVGNTRSKTRTLPAKKVSCRTAAGSCDAIR